MAIEGVVENGQIRLREDVRLPENAKVYVLVIEPTPAITKRIHTPRLANPSQAADFRKQVIEVADDARV
jgi:hypothetical protein